MVLHWIPTALLSENGAGKLLEEEVIIIVQCCREVEEKDTEDKKDGDENMEIEKEEVDLEEEVICQYCQAALISRAVMRRPRSATLVFPMASPYR